MANTNSVEVGPDGDGGWFSTAFQGATKVQRRSRMKHQAISVGIGMALIMRCELIIKNRKGVIVEKNSYGNDPEATKG